MAERLWQPKDTRFFKGLLIVCFAGLVSCLSSADDLEHVSAASEPLEVPSEEIGSDDVGSNALLPNSDGGGEEELVDGAKPDLEKLYLVEELIQRLNSLIQNAQFEGWLELLSDDYRGFYSNPRELARLSGSKRMRSAGIVLEDIEDFFVHVVVPSRANLSLDNLIFYNASEVEAVMNVQGQKISVYRLQLVNGDWKIKR